MDEVQWLDQINNESIGLEFYTNASLLDITLLMCEVSLLTIVLL